MLTRNLRMVPRNLRISRTLFGFALICFFLPFAVLAPRDTLSGVNIIFNFASSDAAQPLRTAAKTPVLGALFWAVAGFLATLGRGSAAPRAETILAALSGVIGAVLLGSAAAGMGELLPPPEVNEVGVVTFTPHIGLALWATLLALLAAGVLNLWALVQPQRFAPQAPGTLEGPPPPWYLSWRTWEIVLLMVPVLILGWTASRIDLVDLWEGLTSEEKGGRRLLRQLFSPVLNWEFMRVVLERMGISILQALMATLFAVVFAVPLSFFAARNLMLGSPVGMGVYYVMRGLFNIFRSLEVLVVAILFVTIVGIGPFAGMLGLLIHTIAVLGKLYSEQIENIDPGPMEAIAATGASRLQTVLYAVVPQIVNPFIAFTIYRWDVNVRMSVIVGFVGGGGVGQLLQQYTGLLKWPEVGTIALVTIVVVWVMDYASARIREKLL